MRPGHDADDRGDGMQVEGSAADTGEWMLVTGQRTFRVLVVDDVAELRLLVRMLLEDETAIELLEAPDGAAAIEAIEAGHVDLVVMDMYMPGMDGLTAAQAILAGEAPPELVAFTSSIDGRLSEAFMAAGASAHFDKGHMPALIAYIKAAGRHA